MTTASTNAAYSPMLTATTVAYKTITVDDLNIAYREAGDPEAPKLVLLHGWPSSSHQYRNLIPALADRFHLVSPDYPGFGNSDTPDPSKFEYTFDKLAEVVAHFLDQVGFDCFGLYIQDYSGPVGFRILTAHPEQLQWLVIQNTNAYEVGFTSAWGGLRNAYWLNRNAENEAAIEGLLSLDIVKATYLTGSKNPSIISPDSWNSDYFVTLQRPFGKRLQLDLFYDYRNNVALYPKWQQFLRENQPPTVIFWGQGDLFFTPEGGEAFLKDIPQAELHRLDAGHFAVEDCLSYISEHIHRFYEEKVAA